MVEQIFEPNNSREAIAVAFVFPGGSNSPIQYLPGYPLRSVAAHGPYFFDNQQKRYIDLWMGYGALLFGHADIVTKEAVRQQLNKGTLYSLNSQLEFDLADRLSRIIPCAQRIKFATTGSEATMYAVRIARAYTRREKIIDIAGNYHGANDALMPTRGVPARFSNLVERVEFNDLEALKECLNNDHSAVILEPVMTNCGCILPKKGYLRKVKTLCKRNGSLLIFDEVVTGFRLAPGGAQELFSVTPDLATFSKVLGGGLPLSAVGGKKEVMDLFVPAGDVFFGGTFHANPLSISAGLSVISRIKNKSVKNLNRQTKRLAGELTDSTKSLGLAAQVPQIQSMFSIFFADSEIFCEKKAKTSDFKQFEQFATYLAKQKTFIPPSQSETCFLSTAHSEIMETVSSKIQTALKAVAKN